MPVPEGAGCAHRRAHRAARRRRAFGRPGRRAARLAVPCRGLRPDRPGDHPGPQGAGRQPDHRLRFVPISAGAGLPAGRRRRPGSHRRDRLLRLRRAGCPHQPYATLVEHRDGLRAAPRGDLRGGRKAGNDPRRRLTVGHKCVFRRRRRALWFVCAGLSVCIVVLGLVSTSSRARCSAERLAPLVSGADRLPGYSKAT
jgi:hypothetical protein